MMKLLVTFIWQLPQNLVGLLLIWWYGRKRVQRSGGGLKETVMIWTVKGMPGAISLGNIVLMSPACRDNMQTVCHELGHCKQSVILGPLYLIVIGLPSLLWAVTHHHIAQKRSYYWFYTERWADRLGGVCRY